MGTKNNPGQFDCFASAEPDEPMFVLLGRDPLAAPLVEQWAERRETARGPSAKVDEARTCAQSMRGWLTKRASKDAAEEPAAVGPKPRKRNASALTNAVVLTVSTIPLALFLLKAPLAWVQATSVLVTYGIAFWALKRGS